jgi:hypothetical protein
LISGIVKITLPLIRCLIFHDLEIWIKTPLLLSRVYLTIHIDFRYLVRPWYSKFVYRSSGGFLDIGTDSLDLDFRLRVVYFGLALRILICFIQRIRPRLFLIGSDHGNHWECSLIVWGILILVSRALHNGLGSLFEKLLLRSQHVSLTYPKRVLSKSRILSLLQLSLNLNRILLLLLCHLSLHGSCLRVLVIRHKNLDYRFFP